MVRIVLDIGGTLTDFALQAEVVMPRELFRKVLNPIDDLRPRSAPA